MGHMGLQGARAPSRTDGVPPDEGAREGECGAVLDQDAWQVAKASGIDSVGQAPERRRSLSSPPRWQGFSSPAQW
eukprot:scaffold119423_cov33-Phaeocystis_antarctica.AAC.1